MLQADTRADIYERHRRELVNYATRLVVRESVAEELAQEAALRLLQGKGLPTDERRIRAWLFRVVSNLAIDHLRRHSTWKELVLVDTRERAVADPEFVVESQQMRGSPELAAIAREHLAVCCACTQARRTMEERYAHSCALVTKQRVCHQCVELDGFFNGLSRDPLDGTARNLDARLAILTAARPTSASPVPHDPRASRRWKKQAFRCCARRPPTSS